MMSSDLHIWFISEKITCEMRNYIWNGLTLWHYKCLQWWWLVVSDGFCRVVNCKLIVLSSRESFWGALKCIFGWCRFSECTKWCNFIHLPWFVDCTFLYFCWCPFSCFYAVFDLERILQLFDERRKTIFVFIVFHIAFSFTFDLLFASRIRITLEWIKVFIPNDKTDLNAQIMQIRSILWHNGKS